MSDRPTDDDRAVHDASTNDAPLARDMSTGPAAARGEQMERLADRLVEGARLAGRYELVALLGQGGMGAVWRARELDAGGREVALKLVLAGREESRRVRFQREGEVTAALNHPGIVRVHAAGELDGLPFLAYELVEGGRTLEHALGADRTVQEKVALIRDVARALGHAHARGVVHRDVKAANILIDASGRVRVADFGLAAAANLERLTQTGAIVGTPTHMAPEQLVADPVGPSTDVWALGVILYQALTGRLPFRGETMVELGGAIAMGRYPLPRELVPSVPAELEAITVTALAPAHRDRYPHGDALADDLDRWLQGRGPSDATLPARRRRRRGRQVLTGAAVVLAVGLVLALVGRVLHARQLDAERDAVAREAERVTRRALSGPAAIAADLAALRALRARLDALSVSAAPSRARLDALEALHADARDGEARRVAALAREGDVEPLARGAASQDPALLDAAMEAGWTRPEVHLLRARAVAARGPLADDAAARRTLRDLEVVEAAGLPLDDAARCAQALALGRLRRADEAAAALAQVRAPPRVVSYVVALARLDARLDRTDEASSALAELLPDGPPPTEVADDAAFVGRHALEVARPTLEALSRDPDALEPRDVIHAIDRVAIAARLGRPPEREHLYALVAATMSLRRRIPARFAVSVADLAPNDRGVQTRLARFARNANSLSKTALVPVARRAYELASIEDRHEYGLVLCVVLDGCQPERPADVEAVASELLADPTLDADMRGTLHELRHEARLQLERYPEALEDVEEALRLLPTRDPLINDRAQVRRLLGDLSGALDDAVLYVRTTDWARHAKVPMGSLDEAAQLVWELGLPAKRTAEVREILDRYLLGRAERWGWTVRAAKLALDDGDLSAARALAERAVNALQRHPDIDERRQFLPILLAVRDSLQAEGPEAKTRLDRLVETLEKVRGAGMVP